VPPYAPANPSGASGFGSHITALGVTYGDLVAEALTRHHCQKLLDAKGTGLEVVYTRILVGLAQQPGTLGTIFRKAQNRIQDPAKLKRLIVDLIDKENWSASGTDLKGDAYEALLSNGASDKGSGAGQYFTPRDRIRAHRCAGGVRGRCRGTGSRHERRCGPKLTT
jgi:hypothetical protein